jgi:hypothetical protein
MPTLNKFENTKTISISKDQNIDVQDLPSNLRKLVEIFDNQRLRVAEQEYELYISKAALTTLNLQLQKAISTYLGNSETNVEEKNNAV